MGDDGGRPRRNVAPVRYNFEPSLEVKREHDWPVRTPRNSLLRDARACATLLVTRSCGSLPAAAICAPVASMFSRSRVRGDCD